MIFHPLMEQAIRLGRKTQTRRPVKGPLRCPECRRVVSGPLCLDCAARTVPAQASRYRPGKDYAVQPGRGQAQTCRVLVTSVHAEPAGAITHEDAQAEGFPRGVVDFAAAWLDLHDHKGRRRPVDPSGPPTSHTPPIGARGSSTQLTGATVRQDGAVLARFEERHAQTMVWVIAFKLHVPDRPRLLATTGRVDLAHAKVDRERRERGQEIPTTDDDRGYTATPMRALPGELEAVTSTWQAWVTAQAGTDHAQWQALEAIRHDRDRHLLSTEDRIRKARTKAARMRIDVSREVWLLENMKSRGRAEEMVEKRVEVLERKAFATSHCAA